VDSGALGGRARPRGHQDEACSNGLEEQTLRWQRCWNDNQPTRAGRRGIVRKKLFTAVSVGMSAAATVSALPSVAAGANLPQYVTPATPPSFTPGPVGPISTASDPIQVFGPLQTKAGQATTSGSAAPTPADAAACKAHPSAETLGRRQIKYSGTLTCVGAVGSTELEICPAEYYNGGWHTASGSSCRSDKGFGSLSLSLIPRQLQRLELLPHVDLGLRTGTQSSHHGGKQCRRRLCAVVRLRPKQRMALFPCSRAA
jgi:hypothetical protein